MNPFKPSLALLTPADSLQRARNLVSWSEGQRATVEATLQTTHENWLLDWGLSNPEGELTSSNQLSDGEARDALGVQLFGPARVLADLPLAEEACPGIAQSVTCDAWDDWFARLCREMGRDVASNPMPFYVIEAKTSHPLPFNWDGRMDITFPWWSGQWSVRLDADSVMQLLGASGVPAKSPIPLPQTALIPLATALSSQPMEVKAHLSPVLLTLGQIQGLRIGDVIPLAQSLDDPTQLRLQIDAAQTFPLCAAWLGQRQGRMAAELAALDPSP